MYSGSQFTEISGQCQLTPRQWCGVWLWERRASPWQTQHQPASSKLSFPFCFLYFNNKTFWLVPNIHRVGLPPINTYNHAKPIRGVIYLSHNLIILLTQPFLKIATYECMSSWEHLDTRYQIQGTCLYAPNTEQKLFHLNILSVFVFCYLCSGKYTQVIIIRFGVFAFRTQYA